MNRLDELTLRLADGILTEEELRELEDLLKEPGALLNHAAMLDLVAALRGKAPASKLVERTMNRVQERIATQIRTGAMGRIHAQGRTAPRSSPRSAGGFRHWKAAWVAAGLAAVALVAVRISVVRDRERSVHEGRRESGAPQAAVKPLPEPPEAPPERRSPIPAPGEPAPPVVEPRIPKELAPQPVLPQEPRFAPEPGKPGPVPQAPPEPPKPLLPTRVSAVVAVVEKAEDASVLAGGLKSPARAGQEILEGEGLEAGGAVTLKWPDGTRLDLRPKTLIRELSGRTGKTVDVARGMLFAQVAAQPADRPMLIQTPLAELRVLGTGFRLSVDPSAEGATQVHVTEGKVRVRRNSDGKSVDVSRGNIVTVSKSAAPLTAQPQTGLLLNWKLDEAAGATVLDSSGQQLHGTLQGDAGRVPGRQGAALRLGPGASLRSQGLQAPELFTVSFWIYQARLNEEQDWLLNLGGGFVLMREGNLERRLVRMGFEGNPQESIQVASVVPAGQWVHLAATFDGSEVRLYSNGGSAGSRKATRRPLQGELSLGPVSAGSEAVFDDVRVYDRALSSPDIVRILQGLPPSPSPRR